MGALPHVWNVGALVLAVADALAARFAGCTVRGELSGFSRAASGHCYFTLKDADGAPAALRCAMFRRAAGLLDFSPRDGQHVEVRGRLAVYEPRGELQFVAESMCTLGAGSLYEQFLVRKARLEAEGLFDPQRKRGLARHPRRIGVISSLGAAALHDVLVALARRAPQIPVIVYPSLVQGVEAPAALVAALGVAGRRGEVDTLILTRGGGSLEDLWAFNDEAVVRAVAASPIPVVCGVGHETDVSLADFAADLRAPTPTAAAELAAPAAVELMSALQALGRSLVRGVEGVVQRRAQQLDRLLPRLGQPAARIAQQSRRLDHLAGRLAAAAVQTGHARNTGLLATGGRLVQAARQRLAIPLQRLATLEARLHALDPQRVVERGYSMVQNADGALITDPRQLATGQALTLAMARGVAEVRLDRIRLRP
ncbi:MAG: exodeoxyribonuclease VII large subunit [Pseudomonadota bacterium]